MVTLVLGSRNPKKLQELRSLLEPLGYDLRLISEFSEESAEETAPTFVENALLKARHAARVSGHAALADDSGLEVDALHGAPGVHSARYSGAHGNDGANNAKLLAALAEVPDEKRGARFISVIALLRHAGDPVPLIAQGEWRGAILQEPRGANGFGYDPLFLDPVSGLSAAELVSSEKNVRSHRARAILHLLALLRG